MSTYVTAKSGGKLILLFISIYNLILLVPDIIFLDKLNSYVRILYCSLDFILYFAVIIVIHYCFRDKILKRQR